MMKLPIQFIVRICFVLVSFLLIFLIVCNSLSVEEIICSPQYGFAISFSSGNKIEIYSNEGEKLNTIYPEGDGWVRLVEYKENITVYQIRGQTAIVYDRDGNKISEQKDYPYDSRIYPLKSFYQIDKATALKYTDTLGYETLCIESNKKVKEIYNNTPFFVFKSIVGILVWIIVNFAVNYLILKIPMLNTSQSNKKDKSRIARQ